MPWSFVKGSRRHAARLLLAGVSCVALAACTDDPTRPQRNALAAAEAQWNASRPAANSYVMVQRRACFCVDGAPHEVTVVNDVIVRVRNMDTGEDLPAAQRVWFRSVQQLFDEVREAIRKDGVLRHVEYDTVHGFPRTVSLDPVPQAVDDEIAYLTLSIDFTS